MANTNQTDALRDHLDEEYLLRRTEEVVVHRRSEEVVIRREKKKPAKIKTHPDGGWGWVVVVAAFLTQFIIVGLQNSSGVIFNELVKKFDRPRGQTGKLLKSSFSLNWTFYLLYFRIKTLTSKSRFL